MNSAATQRGLLLLVITTVGWGMNWPAMKVLLAELPPLTTRAIGGGLGFTVLLVVALAQRQSLVVPRAIWGRLTLISLLNVTAWMGLASFSLLWLSASEATIICYTMPVWAAVFAWLILGEKPSLARILALVLALSGLVYLVLGKGIDLGIAKLPGVALGLGSAILFALGTVLTKRLPLGLPPSSAVAWQVGIGVAPLFIAALIFDPLDFSHVSALGVGLLIYGGVFALGLCYLSWFAALKMLPASLASLGTVITPVVGVVGAALFLGEPFGLREILALTLVLSGVVLAVRG